MWNTLQSHFSLKAEKEENEHHPIQYPSLAFDHHRQNEVPIGTSQVSMPFKNRIIFEVISDTWCSLETSPDRQCYEISVEQENLVRVGDRRIACEMFAAFVTDRFSRMSDIPLRCRLGNTRNVIFPLRLDRNERTMYLRTPLQDSFNKEDFINMLVCTLQAYETIQFDVWPTNPPPNNSIQSIETDESERDTTQPKRNIRAQHDDQSENDTEPNAKRARGDSSPQTITTSNASQ